MASRRTTTASIYTGTTIRLLAYLLDSGVGIAQSTIVAVTVAVEVTVSIGAVTVDVTVKVTSL